MALVIDLLYKQARHWICLNEVCWRGAQQIRKLGVRSVTMS